jgi:hypothetical protein
MHAPRSSIPPLFCWTRFGAEAGQQFSQILARKESERRNSHGLFLWGIGNSVREGIAELLRHSDQPEVLFSPIRSRPRRADVQPQQVFAWTQGETMTGDLVPLGPIGSVLSGTRSIGSPPPHYALICASDEPLAVTELGQLWAGSVRNLLSGKAVGASQVTAVVRHERAVAARGASYAIAFRARLVEPYFVRLRDPVCVSTSLQARGGAYPPT